MKFLVCFISFLVCLVSAIVSIDGVNEIMHHALEMRRSLELQDYLEDYSVRGLLFSCLGMVFSIYGICRT
jgi:hypothetical protein